MKIDPKQIKRILSGNIKKYRGKAKLTQEKAAEKTDITVKYWQRLEMISQVDLPSLQVIFKIAKTLKVPPSKLLDY